MVRTRDHHRKVDMGHAASKLKRLARRRRKALGERSRKGCQPESMCYLPNAPREVGTELSGRAGTSLEAMS